MIELEVTTRKGKPPIFGKGKERWSLGSIVCVHYWTKTADGVEELADEAEVIGLRPGGLEGWIVSISWGPLLDLHTSRPREVNPSQVEWLP